MAMPEGSTLYDLVQTGMSHTHAAVGVVVRLRKELSLVKDIPVLIAVDQVRHISTSHPVIISSDLWIILFSRALLCISIVCSCLVLFVCAFSFLQYNSWFTFSEYEEPVTVRSCRPIHAKELATVSYDLFCILHMV